MTRLGSACEVLLASVGPGDAPPSGSPPRLVCSWDLYRPATGQGNITPGLSCKQQGHLPARLQGGPVACHALWLVPLEMCSTAAPNQQTGRASSRKTPLWPLLLTQAKHLRRTPHVLSTGCGPGKLGGAGRPLKVEGPGTWCLGKGLEPRSGTGCGHLLVLPDF